MGKFGFSQKPYKEKQRQKKILEEAKEQHLNELRQHKRWIKVKKFNPDPILESWDRQKIPKEKALLDLAISNLAASDALESANESLMKGLRLNEAAMEVNGIEDLSYNVYILRTAEILCSKEFAGLSKETTQLFMQALVEQMMPKPQQRLQKDELDLLTKLLKVKGVG